MARGLFRKTSFNKMVGAYRSQWKRFWLQLSTFGAYGKKGMGWWRDPKKAWYNWWYYRTAISIPRLLGISHQKLHSFFAMLVASVVSIFETPVDAARAGVKAHKIKIERRGRSESSGKRTAESSKPKAEPSSDASTGNRRIMQSSSTTMPKSSSEHKPDVTNRTTSTVDALRNNSALSTAKVRNSSISTCKYRSTYPETKSVQKENQK